MFLVQQSVFLIETLICAWCVYQGVKYIHWQFTTGARLRQFAASNGCQPIKRWKDLDPFWGLDVFWKVYKAVKAHKSLQWSQERFDELGTNTGRLNFLWNR